MKNRINYVIYLIIILGFLITISSVGICDTQNTKTIFVSAFGDANYTSIQKAINASDPGDTLIIDKGTYKENIVINKTINIIGKDLYNSIIVGNNKNSVIVVSADNVIISNLTIENRKEGISCNGISIQGNNCTIKYNIITNNSWSGINTGGFCNNCTFNNNIIKNNGYGIFFNQLSSNINFSFNTLLNNKFDGIYLDNSNNSEIDNNTIKQCGDDRIGLSNSNDIIIENNIIENIQNC